MGRREGLSHGMILEQPVVEVAVAEYGNQACRGMDKRDVKQVVEHRNAPKGGDDGGKSTPEMFRGAEQQKHRANGHEQKVE